jgi:hypothetical protein
MEFVGRLVGDEISDGLARLGVHGFSVTGRVPRNARDLEERLYLLERKPACPGSEEADG